MKRRAFLKSSASIGAGLGLVGSSSLGFASATSESCSVQFPQIPGLTKYVADFVVRTTYSDIPDDVIELGKKSLLDGIGLALAGSRLQTNEILQTYMKSFGFPAGGATVIGTASKLPTRFAAFVNGVAIHVEDFDDTQLAVAKDRVYGLLTHPTVPVLPAAFAITETVGRSGKDLMLAYQLGIEVETKIAEAISPRHYEDGFHSTGTCGVFGGTAACAKLRGFKTDQIERAFAIAASQASGLRENFGTMMKPFHAGHAAEVGVFSTDLAALGWSGADGILEAPRGFFHAYGGTYAPAAIMDKLGKPWTFASPGVSIKPFPSGSLTHPGMSEMLRLIRTEHIRAADIEQVEVGTNHNLPNALIHHRPKNALQAKFSMEFCMAILLLDGKAGLREFTDSVVNRRDVQEMIGRVRFYVDPEAEAAGFDKMTTIIKVHLKNGRTLSGRADFAKGSPTNPMSYEEVAEKFYGCANFADWPDAKTKEIGELVRKIESEPDMHRLTALCTR
ncbi:MAG TPA: MmgE/PrpD family protein [Terriglobales bacterium]|nr:MmgE/PrpD family protein [Terriglobales bacterium]